MTFAGASVENHVVVITGGGTGIGAAIADRFAAEGARVVLLGRRAGPLQEVAQRTGGLPIVADAGDAVSVKAAVATIIATYGRVDTLVCNAGGGGFATVENTDDADWAASMHANLTTAFTISREFLPVLARSRGRIVMISSLSGLFAGPAMAGYVTAKHAVIGLTRSLARDYGSSGIRVNAICPGWVRTPLADEEMDELVEHLELADREEAYALVTTDLPLRRVAEPADIAAAVRFLGSDESAYMTGATLVVDGGAHIVDLPTLAFEKARA
ncbi:SDR family NAD(P)-dependent oxidoreductase [Microbacterium sp. LWH12-1.2]|uniref:SDR family NAD(P)-dependent oxidoreductase n=1 Tax=Microbacterium sp. LWH12-1.2 TaxID=3135259 RepID=UPI003416D7E4